jgi:hypothetical protein
MRILYLSKYALPYPYGEALADRILHLYAAWKAGDLAKFSHDDLAEMRRPETAAAKFEDLFRSIAQGAAS